MRVWVLVVLFLVLAGCTSGPLADKVSHVGAANRDLVSPKAYAKLLVEVDSPQGYGPNADAVAALHDALVQVSGRASDAITIDTSDTSIPADPSKKYSDSEVADLEAAHRSHHSGGDTAALYVVYVAGGSTGDTGNGKVLGEAYRGTSIAMFKGNIRSTTTGFLAPSESCVERAVLVHEFGHAAGLVNLGTPMVRPHEDTAGGAGNDPARHGHSANKGSVMYWAVDGSASLLNLLQPVGGGCEQDIPYHFDSDDLADLHALAAS